MGATGDPALVITDAMILIDHQFNHLPPETALQLIEFCRRRLDASESRILADRYDAGASDRDVEDMAAKSGDGKTSKASAKKKARRAKATNANPGLADRLANGSMSTEQADIIADAAADTDGEAACDEELIDSVSGINPEQGKKKAREYVNKRTDAGDVQKKHNKQHRTRGTYRHTLANGNAALTIHGTDEHVDEIERNIHAQSNIEYENDGGRDTPRAKHRRTHDQRNFDAAHTLLTRTANDPDDGGKAKSTSKNTRRQVTIFVTATVDQLLGKDLSPLVGIDGKPLPASFVEQIAGDAAFIAQLFSANGELLWQGRKRRLATPAQINGLISRDKGCVQCGAHPDKCVAHHLLPSQAPRKGPTNINNLALLCVDCHTRLHANTQTMYYELATRTWRIRPATPDETPPNNTPKTTKQTSRYNTSNTNKPHLWERLPKPGIRPTEGAGSGEGEQLGIVGL